jgi:hypothetical protein
VVPETMTDTDMHAHVHPADLRQNPGNQDDFGAESASAPASRDARVIQINRAARQEPQQPPAAAAQAPRGALATETQAALAALAEAADGSPWASPAMTPVAAWQQALPAKGQAANWIIWTALSLGGLFRALWVSLGNLAVHGTDTRTKASMATGALLIAMTLSYLAGHAG